jgi:hypothetical protein
VEEVVDQVVIQFHQDDQEVQEVVPVMTVDHLEDQETVHLQIHHKEIMEETLEVIEVVPEVELAKLVTLMVKAKEAMVQPLQLQDLQ